MTIEKWLNRIGEYNTITIRYDYNKLGFAYYDSRNSIDEKFNTLEVVDFEISGRDVTLFVEAPTFSELSEAAQDNCIDILVNWLCPYEDYSDYTKQDFEYTINELLARKLYYVDFDGDWYDEDGHNVCSYSQTF